MRKKAPRRGSLSEYIAEMLKNAVYEKGEQLDVIVAGGPRSAWLRDAGGQLRGTSGESRGRHRGRADAGLRGGEAPPVVNGCRLAHHRRAKEGCECPVSVPYQGVNSYES